MLLSNLSYAVLMACLASTRAFSSFSLGGTARLYSNTRLRIALSTVENPPVLQLEPETNDDKFNWFKSWYPIVPIEILDPEVPHKFQLLGVDIVVWNDAPIEGGLFGSKKKRPKSAKRTAGGQWRAFVDACPHRKVPLSEGRVEDDGSLLCSYHAWRFDGEGALINVPQLDEEDIERVKANPKSNCNSFPTQVIDGLLWVWPESGPDARLESALKRAPTCQAADKNSADADRLWVGSWNFRELPYGADYFLENVVDPAHVGVSHHNVVGSRYNDQRQKMAVETSLTKDGFAISSFQAGREEAKAITTYHAPSTVEIDTGAGNNGAKQILELYVSPSRPGFSNHVGRMVIVKEKDGKMPSFLAMFTAPVPKWLNHVMAASFLNQDGLFLHQQERTLAKTGAYSSLVNGDDKPTNYNDAVLPIDIDKGVLNYRNWLRLLAGGRIPYKYGPLMPDADNEIVFDQWNGHTKYCQICQTALANLTKVRFAAFFTATCLAVLRPAGNALNLVSVLATAGIGLALNKLIGMFYRYEFSHAHND